MYDCIRTYLYTNGVGHVSNTGAHQRRGVNHIVLKIQSNLVAPNETFDIGFVMQWSIARYYGISYTVWCAVLSCCDFVLRNRLRDNVHLLFIFRLLFFVVVNKENCADNCSKKI